MNFNEINPYVRHVRYLHPDGQSCYQPYIPYDARLFYAFDGRGDIGQNTYTLSKGDIMIINSGIEYHLKTPERHVTYIAVNFDYTSRFSNIKTPIPPDMKNIFKKEKLLESITFDDVSELSGFVYVKDMIKLEPKMINLEYEYVRKLIYYETKLSKLLSEVLVDTVRTVKSHSFFSEKASADKILDFIHENYSKPITNIYIGREFGFHPNYVSSLIKLCTGMPLHQYILDIRLTHSIEYLDSGAFSVSETAEKCGFSDIYHFSKFFKHRVGISPTEYMRSRK